MAGGDHPLADVFRTARRDGLQLIPVTGLIRGDEYQSSCREVIANDRHGVCIRLQKEDFEESDDLAAQVASLLETLGVIPSEADLVLDLRAIGANEGNTLRSAIPVLAHLRRPPGFAGVAVEV
jgi:hypothetical protein